MKGRSFWAFVLMFCSVLFNACKHQKDISNLKTSSTDIPKVIITSDFVIPDSVDYTIDSAQMANDSILTIYLRYQGGCNGSHFKLYNNGNTMKSMPPKTNLNLVHQSELESCKVNRKEAVHFNLSPLKYMIPEENKLILKLSSWKGRLEMKR